MIGFFLWTISGEYGLLGGLLEFSGVDWTFRRSIGLLGAILEF